MKSLLLLGAALLLALPVQAQNTDQSLKHEFRGAWIATVTALDFPASTNPASQQSELVGMLDRLKAAGINAVIFQVRPESDALYPTELAPWSRWLTGMQGRPPSPMYDPLQFAIDEAHKRGMEIHAWFNPYRVQRTVGNYPLDSTHVSIRHPEWTFIRGTGSGLVGIATPASQPRPG